MNKFDIKENSYGHKKRLIFISEQIRKFCLNKQEIRILDVGCGTGSLITLPLGSLGYNILGIDIDKASIDFALKNNIYNNVSFKQERIENIYDKYDIIIASELLEHLENPLEFLNILETKLNENGIIIITTPNGFGWSERESRLLEKLMKNMILKKIFLKFRKNRNNITLNQNDMHLQMFSYKLIRQMFDKANLGIVSQMNGPVFGGPFMERTFAKIPGFKWLSDKLGDSLPSRMVLSWYFVLKSK